MFQVSVSNHELGFTYQRTLSIPSFHERATLLFEFLFFFSLSVFPRIHSSCLNFPRKSFGISSTFRSWSKAVLLPYRCKFFFPDRSRRELDHVGTDSAESSNSLLQGTIFHFRIFFSYLRSFQIEVLSFLCKNTVVILSLLC